MKIVTKGGAWKNTEDEILKAAISKYGKNQWARISSLLVRKTPKQCKARWYEWLDPSIKKTEWSKEEDEKLLHLAKLMPTQWRTIAPIVGRTANQCLERYQKLLDDAEAKDNEELALNAGDHPEAGPSADDIRRLRPGEIDPDPETKAARPDPIDMDEDEKEMLSEARARLANTQGKKAKRKARERQLEEARRLAMLQKRRELKAAGIVMRAKPKHKGMDYMADIPFEKQPAAGFYDVSEEKARLGHAPVGASLRQLEGGKRKQEAAEEAERRKRQKKSKEGPDAAAAAFAPEKDAAIRRLKEAEQIGKRRRLELPQPQVGERELEDIVKIGAAGERARALVDEGGDESSKGLLGEYTGLSAAKTARTPRTAPEQDTVMMEARNQRNRTIQQTPLLGDENTPLHEIPPGDDLSGPVGATPRRAFQATPNPLATPYAARGRPDATPRGDVPSSAGVTPLRTPMRDNLNINTPMSSENSIVGQTPREQQDTLKLRFSSLPAPKNDFELVDPEDIGHIEEAPLLRPEDAAERDAKIAQAKMDAERLALARRSSAIKAGLPRPISIDVASMRSEIISLSQPTNPVAEAERLIALEMVKLLEHDAIAHPAVGSAIAGGGHYAPLEHLSESIMTQAGTLIHHELAMSFGLPGADPITLRRAMAAELDELAFVKSWNSAHRGTAFDASSQSRVDKAGLTPLARMAGLSALHKIYMDKMNRDSQVATKAEKRLEKILGGYMTRSATLWKQRFTIDQDLEQARIALSSFEMLAQTELGAGPRRIELLDREVNKLERQNRDGQSTHSELRDRRDALRTKVEAIEEEVMLQEAEAINAAQG